VLSSSDYGPASPDDPLWKLLGEARKVEVRGNFTANVLRAARNTPQDKGCLASLLARCMESSVSWLRPAMALALVALITGVVWLPQQADTSGHPGCPLPATPRLRPCQTKTWP